jgi:hypothetical protein
MSQVMTPPPPAKLEEWPESRTPCAVKLKSGGGGRGGGGCCQHCVIYWRGINTSHLYSYANFSTQKRSEAAPLLSATGFCFCAGAAPITRRGRHIAECNQRAEFNLSVKLTDFSDTRAEKTGSAMQSFFMF